MYHLNCHLTEEQYEVLGDALYHYGESLTDDKKDIILDQLETILGERARKIID